MKLVRNWRLQDQGPLEIIRKMIKRKLCRRGKKILVVKMLYKFIIVISKIAAGPGYINEVPIVIQLHSVP